MKPKKRANVPNLEPGIYIFNPGKTQSDLFQFIKLTSGYPGVFKGSKEPEKIVLGGEEEFVFFG
jgi:hypothetical protein